MYWRIGPRMGWLVTVEADTIFEKPGTSRFLSGSRNPLNLPNLHRDKLGDRVLEFEY